MNPDFEALPQRCRTWKGKSASRIECIVSVRSRIPNALSKSVVPGACGCRYCRIFLYWALLTGSIRFLPLLLKEAHPFQGMETVCSSPCSVWQGMMWSE